MGHSRRQRALAALLLATALLACRKSEPLPRLYAIPDTQLVADSGNPVRLQELHGSVAIYDFIFTRCAGTCPIATRAMRTAARALSSERDIRFVSITVDPEHDTPAVLRSYAGAVREDERWMFLTGKREEIYELSIKGFKLAAGEGGGSEAILHSTKLVLADREGVVRGYYDSDSAESVRQLVQDAKRLARGRA